MAVFIITGIVLVPIIVMAIFLLNGKGAFLIAGYNTASKAEKAKYNEKALCRFAGWLLIAISFGMLLIPAGVYLEIAWLTYCSIAIILVGSIGAVIYANTGNRFRKSISPDVSEANGNENSKQKTTKAAIIAISIISVIVVIAVCVMLYQGNKDIIVNISNSSIQIKAMYGLSIDFADITNISLIEKSMGEIGPGIRANGYGGIGDALKGHFKSDSLGEMLLFVQSKSSPTILIERANGKAVYISFHNGQSSEDLYRELVRVMQSR